MRSFFLKNHIQNVLEKLFLDPVLNNQSWTYLWINSLKFYTVCFYCILSWGLSKYIETKRKTTCFCLIKAFFLKKKFWSRSPCLISCMIFVEKYFFCYILLTISYKKTNKADYKWLRVTMTDYNWLGARLWVTTCDYEPGYEWIRARPRVSTS